MSSTQILKHILASLPQRQANVSLVADALTARIKTSLNISKKNERRKKTRKGLNTFVSVVIYTRPVNTVTACHSLI